MVRVLRRRQHRWGLGTRDRLYSQSRSNDGSAGTSRHKAPDAVPGGNSLQAGRVEDEVNRGQASKPDESSADANSRNRKINATTTCARAMRRLVSTFPFLLPSGAECECSKRRRSHCPSPSRSLRRIRMFGRSSLKTLQQIILKLARYRAIPRCVRQAVRYPSSRWGRRSMLRHPAAAARGLSIYGSRCPPISSHG
jgi:hypothetical protein